MANASREKAARSHQRETIEAYGANSPVVAEWLARPETTQCLDKFDAADALAGRRQRRYLFTARRAAIFSTIGTVIAAIVLLPVEKLFGHSLPPWLGLVQLASVLVALASIWSISWWQLLDRWMVARAGAEELRAALFRDLMYARPPASLDGKPALAAQLAAFEDCHLDYQRVYYAKRSGQLAKAAGNVAPMKLIGYFIIAASVAVSAIVAARLLAGLGVELPSWLAAIRDIQIPEPARLQLGLGALASAALSFAAAWTLINQDDRNASRYAATLRKLDALKDEGLAKARAAALAGNAAGVLAFTDRVQLVLDAEHSAWVAARPPGDPHAGPGPALGGAV